MWASLDKDRPGVTETHVELAFSRGFEMRYRGFQGNQERMGLGEMFFEAREKALTVLRSWEHLTECSRSGLETTLF